MYLLAIETTGAFASVALAKTEIENGDVECDILRGGGLSNVDEFETWVLRSQEGEGDDETGTATFADADCRMTVMLLAGDQISADSVNEKYDGDYLMFDLDIIENNPDYAMIRDKQRLFETLFGEMPIPSDHFEKAYPANLEKHGIRFENEKSAVVSIVPTTRLVIGSTVERSAWGMMILTISWKKVSPKARAASISPGRMVFMPLIRCSEQKAEGISTEATMTHISEESSTLSLGSA